jgi:hypothetical protein
MVQINPSRWKALLLGLSLGLPLWAQAQEAPLPISPMEARNLASVNLSRVLEWLPPDHLEQYGFSDKDNFAAISIGLPLYASSFTDESVIAGADAGMQTQVVQLPLILEGTARCFIYLSRNEEGRWVASGLGGHNEARTWNSLFTGKEAQRTDHLSMLHIPQNNADYLWQPAAKAWQNVSVGPAQHQGEVLPTDEVFAEAVRIAAEARATVKEDAGS